MSETTTQQNSDIAWLFVQSVMSETSTLTQKKYFLVLCAVCEECDFEFEGHCPFHGPLIEVTDKQVGNY